MTTPNTPVWLLDVDGVVNAATPGWSAPAQQARAFIDGLAYRLRWSPDLVSRIRRLHASGAVEVRWATTWVDHIAQVEDLLELPAFAPAFAGLGQAPSVLVPGKKLEAALHAVEIEQRPLIWTDDDAIPRCGPFRSRLDAATVPMMFLAPDPSRGLQPPDLDAIEDFVERSTRTCQKAC